jgi:hypothetical protein
MNWDGTTAGVEGGDQIPFSDLSRNISDVTSPTASAADPNSIRSQHDDQQQEQQQLQQSQRTDAATSATVTAAAPSSRPRPFARIDAVAIDSPAKIAGLKVDDLIVRFGFIDITNHQNLSAIAGLVPEIASENGEIQIQVLRQQQQQQQQEEQQLVTVSLHPRPWDGRGLIGCHIVPYQPPAESES